MATPSAVFPAAVATDAQLKVANNLVQTTLRVGIDATNTVLFVTSATGFVPNSLISIDKEILSISAVSTTPNPQLTVAAGGRGFDGTTPSAHAAGAKVSMFIDAWHHNALSSEIQAIEQFIGPNGQNLSQATSPFLKAIDYDFPAQSPGGSLAAGSNVITMAPVPPGVNAANVGYKVYISGGSGTAEAAVITGGTAVAGQPSGTLILTCANAHSGAWTVRSASGGIQEAICALPTNGGEVVVSKDLTLRADVVKAGKTQPCVWKLAGVVISGAFSILELASDYVSSIVEYSTGPQMMAANLGMFNNRTTAIGLLPEAHEPFPAGYGAGISVYQSDPAKLTMNQFFHGVAVDMHTSNGQPNQNAAVLGFMSSHGGADPFGADVHAIVPSSATTAPNFVVGVQAETAVDIPAPGAVVWPLLVIHRSGSTKKATAMIMLESPSNTGSNLLIGTDNGVFTDEGIVLIPANDANPLYRAMAITNAANTKNVYRLTKNGSGYFDSSVVSQSYNFIAAETGANNAIAGTFTNQPVPVLVTGLCVVVKLAHTLQAGPNTFNFAGTGAIPIKSHFTPTADVAKGYPVGAMFRCCYDGAVWEDMSQ